MALFGLPGLISTVASFRELLKSDRKSSQPAAKFGMHSLGNKSFQEPSIGCLSHWNTAQTSVIWLFCPHCYEILEVKDECYWHAVFVKGSSLESWCKLSVTLLNEIMHNCNFSHKYSSANAPYICRQSHRLIPSSPSLQRPIKYFILSWKCSVYPRIHGVTATAQPHPKTPNAN